MLKWKTLGKWLKNDSDSNGLLTTISGSRNHGNYGSNLVFATATSPKISDSLKCAEKRSGQYGAKMADIGDSNTRLVAGSDSNRLVTLLQNDKENVDARMQQEWQNFINDVDQLSEWLTGIIGQAESWKPASGDVNSLRVHLERHLAFAIEIETHQAAKDQVLIQGQEFQSSLPQTSQYLAKTLSIIESQWEQLQNQIDVQYQQIEDALNALETSINGSDSARVLSPLSMEQTRDVVDHLTFKLHSKKRKNSPMASQISALNKQMETFSIGQSFDSILNSYEDTGDDDDDNNSSDGATEPNDASQVVGEFDGQCQDMFDFLNEVQLVITEKDSDVLVNQKQYKEICKEYKHEMKDLEVTRRTLNTKGHRLMTAYPNLTSEITSKLSSINKKWDNLHDHIAMDTISSSPSNSPSSMLEELDEILVRLRVWMNDVECQLFNVNYNKCLNSADVSELESKLEEHQALQSEIEKHARGVTAVLTLCNILQDDARACNTERDRETLALAAVNLERRWQAILMQAIDLHSKLEEKVTALKGPTLNDGRKSTPPTPSVTMAQLSDSVCGPSERVSTDMAPSKVVEGLVDYEYDRNQVLENEDLLFVRKAFSENDAFSVSDFSDITMDDELLFDDVLLMKDQEDDESSLERELQFEDGDIFDESGSFPYDTFLPEDEIFPMEDISQEDLDKVQKMRDLASKRQKKVLKPAKRRDSCNEEEKEGKKKRRRKSKTHGKLPAVRADPDIKVVDGRLMLAEDSCLSKSPRSDILSKSPRSGKSSSLCNIGRPTQRKRSHTLASTSSSGSSPRDEIKVEKSKPNIFRRHQQIEEKFPKSVDAVTKAVEEALDTLMPHRFRQQEEVEKCEFEMSDVRIDDARMWRVPSYRRTSGFTTSLMTPEGSPNNLFLSGSQSLSSCSPRSVSSFSSCSLTTAEQAVFKPSSLEDENGVFFSDEELQTPKARAGNGDADSEHGGDDDDMVDGVFHLDLSDDDEEDNFAQYVLTDVSAYSTTENILSESFKHELNFINSELQDVAAEVTRAEMQMFDEMLSKGMTEELVHAEARSQEEAGPETAVSCSPVEAAKVNETAGDNGNQKTDDKVGRKRKLFPSLLSETDKDAELKVGTKPAPKFFPSLISSVEEGNDEVKPIEWTPPSVKVECIEDDVQKFAKKKPDLKIPRTVTMVTDSDEQDDGETMAIYPLLATPRTPVFSPSSEDGETMEIYPLLFTPRTPIASPLCQDSERLSVYPQLSTPRTSTVASLSVDEKSEAFDKSSSSFVPATQQEALEILASLNMEEEVIENDKLTVSPPLVKSTDQFEYPKTPKTPNSPSVSPWATPRFRAPQPPSLRDVLNQRESDHCGSDCVEESIQEVETEPLCPAVENSQIAAVVTRGDQNGGRHQISEAIKDGDVGYCMEDVNLMVSPAETSEWSSLSQNSSAGFEFHTLSFERSKDEINDSQDVNSDVEEIGFDCSLQHSDCDSLHGGEEEIATERGDLSYSDISCVVDGSGNEDMLNSVESMKPSDVSSVLNVTASPVFCSYIAELAEACVLGQLTPKVQKSHKKQLSAILTHCRQDVCLDEGDGSGFLGDVSSNAGDSTCEKLGASYLDYLPSEDGGRSEIEDTSGDNGDGGAKANLSNKQQLDCQSTEQLSSKMEASYQGDNKSDDCSVSYEGSDSEDDGWFDASDEDEEEEEDDDNGEASEFEDSDDEESLINVLKSALQMDDSDEEDDKREIDIDEEDEDGAVSMATFEADDKKEPEDDGSDLQDSGRFSATQSTKSEADLTEGSPVDTSTPLSLRRVDRLLPCIRESLSTVCSFSEHDEEEEKEEEVSAIADVKNGVCGEQQYRSEVSIDHVERQESKETGVSDESSEKVLSPPSPPKIMSDKAQQTDISLVSVEDEEDYDIEMSDGPCAISPRKSFAGRVLCVAIPIHFLLMLFFFIVIVLPSIIENWEGECKFSLTDQLFFSSLSWEPGLKYVKGPPPV